MHPPTEPRIGLPHAPAAAAGDGRLTFRDPDASEDAFGGGGHAERVPVGASRQTPNILFNLARTEQLTGRHVAAAEHFRAYIALPEHPRVTKALRAKAQEYLTQLDAQLGHVALDAPAGAVVRVDGNTETAGASIDVEPGAHAIEARLGEQVGTVDVVAVAGATVPARVVFAAPKAVGPVVPAPVVVVVPPVEPPVTTPRSQDESHTTRDVLRWTTAGVAVAGVAVGVAFLVEAHSQASDFNAFHAAHPRACTVATSAACTEAHSKDSTVSQSTTISGVGFAVGGVAAVTSAALWLLWPRDSAKPSSATWVTPQVGPGFGSVEVGGRF